MTLLLVLTAWFAVMNVVTFFVYRSDKRRAERGELRTPELTLHMLGLFGGALGAFLGMRICRHKTKKIAFRATVLPLMILQVMTWVCVAALTIYSMGYYKADDTAKAAMESDQKVTVSHEGNLYRFDGPGVTDAFVFYPGGLVETTAYAPLMRVLAENGVDCFLVDMPYHLAYLGLNAAGDVMADNAYDHWFIGGHSLGGSAASQFAVGHSEQLEGIVLLASYSTTFLPEKLKTLCVYGTHDWVLTRDIAENNHVNLPEGHTDLVIQGANHAQYGNYGSQKKDGIATISAEEQQAQTAKAILELIWSY